MIGKNGHDKKHHGIPPVLQALLLGGFLVIGPLSGVVMSGRDPAPYLEFPPLTVYIHHRGFSWPAFLAMAFFIALCCGPLILRLIHFRLPRSSSSRKGSGFPWWGRAGLLLVAVFWVLAWNRFSWFAPWQRYTFFPLWFGYILVINGLCRARTGTSPLEEDPRLFWTLFPASALFWWYFEYLNRFVQNWHYYGVAGFSPLQYVLHASLCFSTVLPAVLSTHAFLAGFCRLRQPFRHWRPVRLPENNSTAALLLAGAGLSLAGISLFPDFLFPLLWISPLLVITAMDMLRQDPTLFTPLRRGDWSTIFLGAAAALVCGFFWELWNWQSLAHWEYSVPFVQRFHIFHMPLLGYAGYLPFGLECLAAGDLVRRWVDWSIR